MVYVLNLPPETEAEYHHQLAALGPQGLALANLLHYLSNRQEPTAAPAPVYVRQAYALSKMHPDQLLQTVELIVSANTEMSK